MVDNDNFKHVSGKPDYTNHRLFYQRTRCWCNNRSRFGVEVPSATFVAAAGSLHAMEQSFNEWKSTQSVRFWARHSLLKLPVVLLAVIVSSTPAQDKLAAICFENVTGQSGIDFILDNGATPEKRLIETMPGGVAVFDYDGDGRPDIFF